MKKRLKQWLAVILAIAIMASSVVIGFAADASFADVSFAQYCTEMPGGYRFIFSEDYEMSSSYTATLAELYQEYKNAINDPSKVVLFSFYEFSGSRLVVSVLDAATLNISYKTISGTNYIQFTSSDCSYLTFLHTPYHKYVQTMLHGSIISCPSYASFLLVKGLSPWGHLIVL